MNLNSMSNDELWELKGQKHSEIDKANEVVWQIKEVLMARSKES